MHQVQKLNNNLKKALDMNRFLRFAILLLTTMTPAGIWAQTGGDAIIYPDYKGDVIDKFFLDIKGNAGGVGSESRNNFV